MTPRRRLPSAFDLDWENQKTPVWNQWTGPNLSRSPSSDVTEETEWHVSVVVRTQQIRRLVQLGIASSTSLAWRWGLPMWTPISGIPELVGAIRRPPPDSGPQELATYQLAPLQRRRLSRSGTRNTGVADWAKLMSIPGSKMDPQLRVQRIPPPVLAAEPVRPYEHEEQSRLRLKAPARGRRTWALVAMVLAAAVGWSVGSVAFRKDVASLRRATFPALPPQPARAALSAPAVQASVPAVSSAPAIDGGSRAAPAEDAEAKLGRAQSLPAQPSGAGAASSSASPAAENEAPRGPFDTARAARALKLASGMAASCFERGEEVSGRVVVMFAPTGRVTSVKLLGFSAPGGARCVQAAFRRIKVPAFDGPSLTVGKSFQLRG